MDLEETLFKIEDIIISYLDINDTFQNNYLIKKITRKYLKINTSTQSISSNFKNDFDEEDLFINLNNKISNIYKQLNNNNKIFNPFKINNNDDFDIENQIKTTPKKIKFYESYSDDFEDIDDIEIEIDDDDLFSNNSLSSDSEIEIDIGLSKPKKNNLVTPIELSKKKYSTTSSSYFKF